MFKTSISWLPGLLIFLSCATTKAPLQQDPYVALKRRYPERFFILGIGETKLTDDLAVCRQAAEDKARENIAKQIRIFVEGRVKSIVEEQCGLSYRDRQVNEKTFSLSHFLSVTEVSTQAALEGVRIIKSWSDPKAGLYRAVAVLDREAAAARLVEKINVHYQKAHELITWSQGAAKKGDFFQALRSLLFARQSAMQGWAFENDYRVIAGPLAGISPYIPSIKQIRPNLVALEDGVLSLIADLRLEKVKGDGQSLSPSASKPMHPLKIRVSFRDQPVPGFPVRFFPLFGTVSLDTLVRTDEQGIAHCEVRYVDPSSPSCIQIKAVPCLLPRIRQATDPKFFGFLEGNLSARSATFILYRQTRPIVQLDAALEALATDIARVLAPRGQIKLAVEDFCFEDSRASGEFGHYVAEKLRGLLVKRPEIQVVSFAYDETFYRLRGRYWERQSWVDVMARVEDPSGIIITSSQVQINRAAIGELALRPTQWVPVLQSIASNYSSLSDLRIRVWCPRGKNAVYHEGETFWFYLWANRDCYIYVVDFRSDGTHTLLIPNQRDPRNFLARGGTYKVPDQIGRGYHFRVEPPFGTDVIKVFASERPLNVQQVLSQQPGSLALVEGIRGLAVQPDSSSPCSYTEASLVITTMR